MIFHTHFFGSPHSSQVATAVRGTSSPLRKKTKKSRLAVTFNPSLKKRLTKSIDYTDLPGFLAMDEVDGNQVVRYRPEKLIRAKVSNSKVRKLINVELDGDEVVAVSFVPGVDRADEFNELMSPHFPAQFGPVHRNSKVNKISTGKRGRKAALNLIAQFGGRCAFHPFGCPTTWNGGFRIDQLALVGKGVVAEVEMIMGFDGNGCVHPPDAPAGRLTGLARKRERDKVRPLTRIVVFQSNSLPLLFLYAPVGKERSDPGRTDADEHQGDEPNEVCREEHAQHGGRLATELRAEP